MEDKRLWKILWDFLGSRNFSVFVFVMGLTYVLFLVVFALFVPLPWVSRIAILLPFKVLYLFFFVNLIICEIKWIPVIVRRCRKPERPENPEDFDRYKHKVRLPGSELQPAGLARYFRFRWYRVCGFSPDNLPVVKDKLSILFHCCRGRFSPIGNLLFHLSFILLFVGVMISMMFRFEGSARVTEGFEFSGSLGEYASVSLSPFASIPKVSFLLEKISPAFWEDKLLFTDLRADVKLQEGQGRIWLSGPLNIGGADVTLQGINLTPMYVLKDRLGRTIDRAYVNLAIFTPASEDHFVISGFPHQIFVSYYPDYEIENGKVVNRSMNPVNPAFGIKIFRGRVPVYSNIAKLGEEIIFENLRLSFPDFIYSGNFRIVRDPGFQFIWTSFILFVAGLAWKLLFYRREIVVASEKGAIYLYGNSDYYHLLFENSLKSIAGKFGESKGASL